MLHYQLKPHSPAVWKCIFTVTHTCPHTPCISTANTRPPPLCGRWTSNVNSLFMELQILEKLHGSIFSVVLHIFRCQLNAWCLRITAIACSTLLEILIVAFGVWHCGQLRTRPVHWNSVRLSCDFCRAMFTHSSMRIFCSNTSYCHVDWLQCAVCMYKYYVIIVYCRNTI